MAVASDVEPARARVPQRFLLFAFLAVAVSFLAASAYSQLVLASIDRSAGAIATNASPSIEALANARSDLGELQYDVFAAVRAAMDNEPYRDDVTHAHRAALEQEVERYFVLPRFAGEEVYWRRITSALEALDQAIAHVLARARGGDAEEARLLAVSEFRPAVERASLALRDATRFNAERAAELATRIEVRRQRSVTANVVLDCGCLAAATALAVVMLRLVRAYGRVVESRNELLERRADELEVFASRVSHDILGPLGTITLALGLVQRRVGDDPELGRMMTRATSGVDRAARIVRDLLGFARAGANPAPGDRCDLRTVLRDVLDGASAEAAEACVELASNVEVGCSVACASGVLTSIVANLVRNAIKYMGDAEERRVVVHAREHDGRVTVEVSDTGPGIRADLLDVIFLPHVRGQTAGRPGLGLGLATVKRLVESHGGSVSVRSERGRGSTFAFELPCAPALQP